jgi:branched-chain amino acid transport system permease protein
MEIYLQLLVAGLLMGALYGVIALSLSLIYGVGKLTNFAHGDILMICMYIPFWIWAYLKLSTYISIFILIPVFFLLGYCIQVLLVEPLLKKEDADVKDPTGVLLTTMGLSLLLSNGALFFFKADYRGVNSEVAAMNLKFAGLTLNLAQLIALIGAIILALLLLFILNRTYLGKAIRAVAQDREAARMMGINDFGIFRITFGITIIILGLAGGFLLPFYFIHPGVGEAFTLRSFVIVVLGGLGSTNGAFIAGILIGVIESFMTQIFNSATAEIIVFAVFVLVLIYRPSGLFGTKYL